VEQTGAEKAKLFPTDIGMVVNDFLLKYFDLIMDYNFTAKVEKEFDEIAEGEIVWNDMIRSFYDPFHSKVEGALNEAERTNGSRVLGIDPATGKELSVKIGRFGPIAQLGEMTEGAEKPLFASLRPGQHLETITLEEALELFKLPRTIGDYEGKPVSVAIGRFGPYIRHNSLFVSLDKNLDDPYTVDLERAIALIESKREKDKNAVIKVFDENPEVKLLNGRWGAYLSYKKNNYKLPKGTDATKLSYEECMQLIEKQPVAKKGRKK
jgi:DNA topoisomerase-1